MGAVTVSMLNSYINNYEDDTLGLKQIYLDSAYSIIKDYLGYDFLEQDYTEVLEGDGNDSIQLCAYPINTLTSVSIDGESIDVSNFTTNREKLYYTDNVFPNGSRIVISHTSGNDDYVGIFNLVVLQIAGLLFTESNGNIGITSRATMDNNTRTFIRTTNFDPYLQKLDSYKVIRYNV